MLLFKKWAAVVCLLLCNAHALYAQNKTAGFYVAEAASKIPLPEAVAQTSDQRYIFTANEAGFISLGLLPDTITTLFVSRIGFETKAVAVAALTGNTTPYVIYLTATVSSLQEVTVRTSGATVFQPISDLDIHLRPIANSQEVLRVVPGLFIGQHAGGGKAEQIFLRGFDIDHGTDIAISVDGMPVNMVSHAHGQGYADLHFVIPELIDRVSFNKGPYYAEKGNFTTAGYVDFKIKDYLKTNFVKAEGGPFQTFRGVAGFNLLKPHHSQRNHSLYVGGEASFTNGFFESPQHFKRFNGILKYHGAISNNTLVTASLTGFTSTWNASGQIPSRAVKSGLIGFYGAIDNTEGGQTARYNANVQATTSLGANAKFRNQIYYTRYAFELYSNFTFFKEDRINGDQIRQKESRNLMGYNGSYTNHYFVGGRRVQTKIGMQFRYDVVADIELTRTKQRTINTAQIMLGNVAESNGGMYVDQKISLTKKLALTPGLRADYFTNQYYDQLANATLHTTATIISPKVNLDVDVSNKVHLYLYTGRGFHSNDTRVAVQQGGRRVLPPAYGTDMGGVFKAGNKAVLQTAFWYLYLQQEFVYVGDEGVVEPGSKTTRMGIDVTARYELLKNLFADADLSFAHARAIGVPKAERYLPLAPRLSSVGGITYRRTTGINGSLRYRLLGKRPANETNTVVAQGYVVADASVNYTKKRWEGGIAIVNVCNTKWKETQFDTESRLQNEAEPITEIHFTPGTPLSARATFTLFF